MRRRNTGPSASPTQAVQARELQRELERQEVLLAQVEPRDPLDPLEPLAHGVGMDEQARALAATLQRGSEVALERLDELSVAAPVVLISSSTACP